jgi:hypothetical protein
MADRDTPSGDELALKDNGTIRIMLAGKGATWRRPTLGEYKKFAEARILAGEEEERVMAEIETEAREAAGTAEAPWPAGKPPPYTGSQRLRLEIAGEDVLGAWAIDVWRVLCEKEPPALDELPLWMTVVPFSQTIFQHWRELPKAGSSSR